MVAHVTARKMPTFHRHEKEKFFVNAEGRKESVPSIHDPPTRELSVVVPSYNEEDRLPLMMDEALDYLEKRQKRDPSFTYEVIVVDDGSKDETTKVAMKYCKKYGSDKVRVLTLVKNRGKGGAVRMGVFSSRGKKILMVDADGATKFADIEKVEEGLKNLQPWPNEMAISCGSRAHLEKDSVAKRSYFRTILMYGFHFLVWFLCVKKIRDTQCGFKLLTREAALRTFSTLHIERWAFDVELLYIAQRLRIPIAEVAVNWTEIEGSKLVPFWSWLQMGRDLLFIRLRYMTGAWQLETRKYSETIRLPYEEGELLEYLDAEELPPILVDLLEKSQVNIFHCGCVIAEIRDYRQSGNMKSPTYQSKHILLRPTMQTLICDVHSITSDNHKWTQEDKLLLESQLILATAEPLCLDPSIAVTCTTNRLLYNKQKMNTRPMKRCFKRYSRSSLNRQQEVAHYSTPPQLRLLDYLQKRKERKGAQQYDLKISKAGNCVDMWKQNPCYLTAPSEVDVEKYAKVEKSIKPDDSQPTVWPAHEIKDDYVFECEVGNQLQKTKLTIFQSLGNPLYYGKIQTLKGDEENDNLLTPSQFLIGSKTDAERVVNQYQELVQNEAKCPVKMFHNSGGSVSLSHLSPGKEMEQPESISGSVQSSVLGKGVKHRPPPIKLPSSSGSSSSGNIFSPQQSSGHLKSPTPPPPSKPPGLSRKQSMDLNQVSMLSPAAMSPASSSQRSGTPKPSTPTPTNTPSSTPHPPDAQSSTPITPSATPTPQDSGFTPQPTLLTPFAQQQMSLSQALPVMTIPLSTMVTSITTGTASTQVMANPAGLNFINVVGSVCGAQTLMSGSNPMLGCNTGAIAPAGINLSGILPSGGLVPNALPAAMQSASQAGSPFGLKNASNLRPLNLLQQLPGGSLTFNPLQQQPLSQFSPQQQSQQPLTCSPQQQGEQGSDQGPSTQDQALSAQQAAVINLTGVGNFVQPQATVLSQLGSAVNRPGQSHPQQRLQLSSALQQQQQALQQQQQQIQQLRFLQHQMATAAAAAQAAHLRQQQHSGSHSKSKRKRGTSAPPQS